jgi:multiple antibiotic resistance protein
MHGELQFLITSFSSLFFIVDPFAVVPIFLSLTERFSRAKRAGVARRSAFWCGAILLVFATSGTFILKIYGLGLPALKGAGGVILLLVALDMLRTRRSTQESPEEIRAAASRDDISLAPLATPMLAGPGAISTVMVLMGQARGDMSKMLAVLFAVLAVSVLSYVVLRLAEPLNRILGESGRRALTRVMGLLLAAIAMQFLFDGLRGLNL